MHKLKNAKELIVNEIDYVKAIKLKSCHIFYIGAVNEALEGNSVKSKRNGWVKSRIKLSYDDSRKNQFILETMKRQKLKSM